MRKGFTVLELLVASLLLGMLVTILTMIFNQSSIAWRTGLATVADMDLVRDNMGTVREEADNIYIWNNKMERLLSPWDESGNLRDRAISCDTVSSERPTYLKGLNDTSEPKDFATTSVGSATAGRMKSYSINIKSAGPNKVFGDYDDIWSSPDEFDME